METGNQKVKLMGTLGHPRTWLSQNSCRGSYSEIRTPASVRVRLVVVKRFPENTYFPEMLISEKGKCFPLFGCLGNRFPENQFRCLVRPNILRKSFYEKSIPVFVLLHCCQTCRKMKVHNSSSTLGSQYSIILGKKEKISKNMLSKETTPF